MSNYIEFRGYGNTRLAISKRSNFMVLEINEHSPLRINKLDGTQDVVTTGCLLYQNGFPSMHIMEFYPVILERMNQISSIVDSGIEKLNEKFSENPKETNA